MPASPPWLRAVEQLAAWPCPSGVEHTVWYSPRTGVVSVVVESCCHVCRIDVAPGDPMAVTAARLQAAAMALLERDESTHRGLRVLDAAGRAFEAGVTGLDGKGGS